jgi:hypothetical protein
MFLHFYLTLFKILLAAKSRKDSQKKSDLDSFQTQDRAFGDFLNSGSLGDGGGVLLGDGVESQSGDAPGGFHRSPKGWR